MDVIVWPSSLHALQLELLMHRLVMVVMAIQVLWYS
jgi:hypothetical protein